MATALGDLVVRLAGDSRPLGRELRRSEGMLRGFVSGATNTLGRIGLAAQGIAAGVGAVRGALQSLVFPISLAADAESTAIAFEVLIGNAKQARDLLEGLVQFAAKTPLRQDEINGAARMLLAFGVEVENVIPTLQRLGDVSSGIQQPIGEIAEIYGKARVQGRLFAEDVNQFTGRGIPIIQELAKQFGVAESEVKELVKEGKVGFDNLEQAFKDLTAEGAKFGGMMERSSKSLNGLWSTLMDNLSIGAKEIGMILIEELDLKPMLTDSIKFAEVWKEEIKPVVQDVAAVMGDIKDALVAITQLGSRLKILLGSGDEQRAAGADMLQDWFNRNIGEPLKQRHPWMAPFIDNPIFQRPPRPAEETIRSVMPEIGGAGDDGPVEAPKPKTELTPFKPLTSASGAGGKDRDRQRDLVAGALDPRTERGIEAILEAIIPRGDSPEKKIEKAAEQQVSILERTERMLARIEDNTFRFKNVKVATIS